MRGPLSAAVFRRGGPKKELFDATTEGPPDDVELQDKLRELREVLLADKSG